MPWIKALRDFAFIVKRKPLVMQGYRQGNKYLVKQACADESVAQGNAQLTERPGAKDDNARR